MAALIKDLKARGMLDRYSCCLDRRIWTHPRQQQTGAASIRWGRGHNVDAMTMLFAGGGIKPGVVGGTDELGRFSRR